MDERPEHPPTREPATPVEPPKLDYAVPPKKTYGRDLDGLIRRLTPPSDPELRRWWWKRVGYRIALFSWLAVIAFYFGPNVIEFGKLTHPELSDFVPIVEREGVPLVRAVKQYKLEHGSFPKDQSDLVPDYLPAVKGGASYEGIVVVFADDQEWVQYSFNPGTEGWWLEGPWLSGRLPLPPVTIDPSSRPRTRPVR